MKTVKLTMKTAKNLIGRIDPRLKVVKDDTAPDAAIFRATTGPAGLDIVCENDWATCNGRISLTITEKGDGRKLRMYFYPDTLDRDFPAEMAEMAEWEEDEREARIKWVAKVGKEQAHKLVDQYWEG